MIPIIFAFILTSGFILAQLPNILPGDNVIRSAEAKLVYASGFIPKYLNTYANSYPYSFILSAVLSQMWSYEPLYVNVILVALIHIIYAIVLYTLLQSLLRHKLAASIITCANFIGNFYFTYFHVIFTPRLFTLVLFYLGIFLLHKPQINRRFGTWFFLILIFLTLTTCHATTPSYLMAYILGLIVLGTFNKLSLLLLGSGTIWILWHMYISNTQFEQAVKIMIGELSLPWHAMYGVQSPFIQEQFNFQVDILTAILRLYRITLIIIPYIAGGIGILYSLFKYVKSWSNKGESYKEGTLTQLGLPSLFLTLLSITYYIILGRGHEYFMLYTYPLFCSLSYETLNEWNVFKRRLRSQERWIHVAVLFILSVCIMPTYLSLHSARLYFGLTDINALTFLSNYGANMDISTSGDVYYTYSYFNPTYFWPGKQGRQSLIYATPQELLIQYHKICYVFQGDVTIRSFKQMAGFYFSGLSQLFWNNVDRCLNIYRSRIYDNNFVVIHH